MALSQNVEGNSARTDGRGRDGRLEIVQKRREGAKAAASSILFNPISRRKRLSTYICLRRAAAG